MWHLRFIWKSCIVRSLHNSSSIHSANAKRKCLGSHILSVHPLLLSFLLDLLQPCAYSYCPSCELNFLPWRCRQKVTLKFWFGSIKLHDVKSENRFSSLSTWTFASLFDLNLGSRVKHVKICYLEVCFCVKRNEAVEIRVTSGTPCGGLRRATGAHKMKETKVLPFSVVKISFLLFLAYVGSVYM